jgi:hypothetical protein
MASLAERFEAKVDRSGDHHLWLGAKVAAPRYMLATAGEDAAALGVATLPIYAVFAPVPNVLLKRSRGPAVGLDSTPEPAGG